MIKIITGNLLEATEQYIAHQANCVSYGAAGLADAIFRKYPYADVYQNRTQPSQPGTIEICGNGKDQRYIIGMFAQYYPGGSSRMDFDLDGNQARENYFYQCLQKISQLDNLESIAFPYKIGSGLAGGNWEHYFDTLHNFADYVQLRGVQVVIYMRPEDT